MNAKRKLLKRIPISFDEWSGRNEEALKNRTSITIDPLVLDLPCGCRRTNFFDHPHVIKKDTKNKWDCVKCQGIVFPRSKVIIKESYFMKTSYV